MSILYIASSQSDWSGLILTKIHKISHCANSSYRSFPLTRLPWHHTLFLFMFQSEYSFLVGALSVSLCPSSFLHDFAHFRSFSNHINGHDPYNSTFNLAELEIMSLSFVMDLFIWKPFLWSWHKSLMKHFERKWSHLLRREHWRQGKIHYQWLLQKKMTMCLSFLYT